MIAALYVETNGVYFGLPDVDPWDARRDAMRYDGPHPVVAHPPCSRWCRLAGLVQARWADYVRPQLALFGDVYPSMRRGEDGGTFAHALHCVRTFGGVLEHPAYSDAWRAFDLPPPPRHGGWVLGPCGGFAAHVEQCRYGHVAKKATWLYAFGVDLPALRWGSDLESKSEALVSWCGNRVASGESRPRVGKAAASRSPLAFRDVLLSIARSAR